MRRTEKGNKEMNNASAPAPRITHFCFSDRGRPRLHNSGMTLWNEGMVFCTIDDEAQTMVEYGYGDME